jgi:hypothetical protein
MTINVTLYFWMIPVVLTLLIVGWMFRPYRKSGDYDFTSIFRLFWLIPMLFVWVVYLGLCLYLKQ